MRNVAKTLYDNLDFTHKMHEKQCEILSIASVVVRLLSVCLIVAVLFLQFWQFLQNTPQDKTLAVWSVILTVVEVGVAFFQLNFNYDKLLDQHRGTAKALLAIKNRFRVDMAASMTRTQLDAYVTELNAAYQGAPQTGSLAKFLANRS